MVRSVVRQVGKKTQQKSNKEVFGKTRQECLKLSEEGQRAADKLLTMVGKWRMERMENRWVGHKEIGK